MNTKQQQQQQQCKFLKLNWINSESGMKQHTGWTRKLIKIIHIKKLQKQEEQRSALNSSQSPSIQEQ
jgi:hypothetical protein